MTLRACLLPLALALLAVPAGAQDTASDQDVHLSLSDAVARARERSARLLSLSSLETAAGEGVRGARAGRLPQADLSASYTRNSNVPELVIAFPGAPPRTIFPNIPDNLRSHAGVSLPIYTAGRVTGQIDAARALQGAATADRQTALQDLVLETQSAYVWLVTARESAHVLGEAVDAYESHRKDAENREAMGMAARNEVMAVTVERERALLQRLQADNAAAVATANLLRLVDLPAGTRLETDPLEPVTAADVDAEALVAQAHQTRAELAALRARAAAAEAQVRVARSAALPQAALSGGYDYARPNTRILPLSDTWNGTWSIGGAVTWNAFDGGRSSAAAAQARAQAEALRQQVIDLERRVSLEVTTRTLDLASARLGLAVAERALAAARENLRVVRDRYAEGVVSSSDLLDAENVALRAGLERTGAVAQLQVAAASLDRAVGR